MRVFGHCAVAGCLAAAAAFSGATALGTSEPAIRSAAQSKDPAAILATARQALGGDAKLVGGEVVHRNGPHPAGPWRQPRPDRVRDLRRAARTNTSARTKCRRRKAGRTRPASTARSFVRSAAAPPPTPPARRAAPNPAVLEAARKARVTTVKQDFARLTLGMFAASFPSYPLTFTYVGEAEAPQGKADVHRRQGAEQFHAPAVHQSADTSADHGQLAGPARPRPRTGRSRHARRGGAWRRPATGRGQPG